VWWLIKLSRLCEDQEYDNLIEYLKPVKENVGEERNMSNLRR
jgi:hypothetical protein